MSDFEFTVEQLGNSKTTTGTLILFTRYPVPGTTKTRLIPALGALEAAQLQRHMTEHALNQARQLQRRRAIQPVIAYEGGDENRMRSWLGEDLVYMTQGAGSIGDRMHRAFAQAKRLGLPKTVIIGTDIPQLTADTIWQAFQFLEQTDLVLGPATDGGYYLIGMGRMLAPDPPRKLFDDIAWGTGQVLEQTLFMAQRAGFSWTLLDELQDVDRPEDLALLATLADSEQPL